MRAEPTVVWMPGGVRTEIHLGGEDTGGAFCLLRDELPSGWSLPPHRHPAAAETIHVLAGELGLTLGGGEERIVRAQGRPSTSPQGSCTRRATPASSRCGGSSSSAPPGWSASSGRPGRRAPRAVDPQAVLQAAVRNGWDFG